MYVLSAQLRNLPVVSLQNGRKIALAREVLVQPSNLEVIAWECQTGRGRRLLLARDIRQLAKDCLVVDSEDELSEADEIVRLQDLLRQKFKLLGLPAVSESGHRLGRVEDFSVNIKNWLINKLYVRPPLFKSLVVSNLIIDRAQIVDVNPKQVTVADATVKRLALAPQPARPRP